MSSVGHFKVKYDHFDLNVSVTFEPGITVILGCSGSGKSTLLRCLAGLEKGQKNYLRVNEVVWQDDAHHYFLPTHLRSLAYVTQTPYLFPHLSVQENLELGYQNLAKTKRLFTPTEVITWLGLSDFLKHPTHTLSGGQRQRVALGRSLLMNPQLLLMDEPVSSLDSQGKQEILSCIHLLSQKLMIPMVYVTHNIEELLYLANHVLVLRQGKISFVGSIQQAILDPHFLNLYR